MKNEFSEQGLLDMKRPFKVGEGITREGADELNTSAFEWCYEDDLPVMTDSWYDQAFPYSRVIDGVRMFPFIWGKS